MLTLKSLAIAGNRGAATRASAETMKPPLSSKVVGRARLRMSELTAIIGSGAARTGQPQQCGADHPSRVYNIVLGPRPT